MNKKFYALFLSAAMTVSLCACGSAGTDKTEASGTEAVAATEQGENTAAVEDVIPYEYDTPASSSFEIDPTALVTTLAPVDAFTLSVSADYEVTEEYMTEYLQQCLNYYGYDCTIAVEDRDTVAADDWVNVDYTGYLNDTAFDGGAAASQIISVAGNCSVDGNGYIEGFTAGLEGAKVGDEISCPVTFPENYGNADLAGQETVFVFKINAIVELVTFDTMTDQMVAQGIGSSFGFETVEELKSAIESACSSDLADAKNSALEDYLLANCVVEIPEDYLEARTNEYIAMVAKNYCSAGQTFEEYLSANGTSLDDIRSTFVENTEETIKLEWIMKTIAANEGRELDEELYQEGLTGLLENNSNFADSEALFTFYGNGNAADGELYIRDQYLVSMMMTELSNRAEIIYE